MLNRTRRSTRPSKRSDRSWATTPPRSPAQTVDALVPEHAADERLHVARVGGGVVAVVGRQAGVAEAAQVGHDHLEAGLRPAARRCATRSASSRASRGPAAAASRPRPRGRTRSRRRARARSIARSRSRARLADNLIGRWRTATTPSRSSPSGSSVWADERTWEVSNEPDERPEGLRARDAAVPLGRAAHRPPEDLLGRRRHRPLPPPQRPPRAAPDGLRRLRPAGREPRDQDRPAPARVHRGLDRRVPAPVPRAGASRSTGRASSAPTSRATTAGRSGSSCACSSRASPTARRPRSSGAPRTRPCSPTSR